MNRNMYTCCLALLVAFGISTAARGQPSTPDAKKGTPEVVPEVVPGEQTSEEEEIVINVDRYLDAPVVTVSKREEKVQLAPAIVSVVTAEEIEDMQPETLYDVLGKLPGIEVIETYYGYTSVTFRGVLQTHYNDKSLMLVNGTPLYDTVNWSYYLEQVPISSIKQLEVIRGPGSTQYGTNAFAGVINVVTHDGKSFAGKKNSRVKLSARYGSFNTLDLGFAGGFHKGMFSAFVAGTFKDSDGYDFDVEKDEEGKSGQPTYLNDRDAYENDYANVYANFGIGNLKIGASYFVNDKDKFGLVPALISTGERHLQGMFVDARYEAELTKDIRVTPLAYMNYIHKNEDINWYPPLSALATAPPSGRIGGPEYQEFGGMKTGADLRLDWKVMENVQLQAGAVFEYTTMDNYLFNYGGEAWNPGADPANPNPPVDRTGEIDEGATAIADRQNTYDTSGYIQGDVWLLDRVGITAGLRLNYNRDYGAFLAPRGGLVVKILEGLSAKALYGRAYRAPGFFEKNVQTTNVLLGGLVDYTTTDGTEVTGSLDPETVDTVDVGLDWKKFKHSLRLNYFFLKTSDLISRSRVVPADATFGDGKTITRATPQYGNTDGYWINGAELDVRGSPVKGLKYSLNVSYRYGQDADGNKLQYFAPLLANLGASYRWYKWANWLTTSLYLQFISERSGTLLTPDADGAFVDQGEEMSLDPYVLLSAVVTTHLGENLDLSIIGHNLLAQDFGYPEYIRKRITTVPGGPGTSVFGKLTMKF